MTKRWNTLLRGVKMADEQKDNLKNLVEQLINEKCIVIMEKLSTDLDYIELDTSDQFYTNVIFHPKNLTDNLIEEISERIRKKVIDATQNIGNEKIVLVPLVPDDELRAYFLHDDINMWDMIEKARENTNFGSEKKIEYLKKDQKVVVVSSIFIGESIKLPHEVEKKEAKLVKVIFILGVPPSIRAKLAKIDYDEIIPIVKVEDDKNLLVK